MKGQQVSGTTAPSRSVMSGYRHTTKAAPLPTWVGQVPRAERPTRKKVNHVGVWATERSPVAATLPNALPTSSQPDSLLQKYKAPKHHQEAHRGKPLAWLGVGVLLVGGGLLLAGTVATLGAAAGGLALMGAGLAFLLIGLLELLGI